MEIYEQRDPAFWRAVVSHPAVEGALLGHNPDFLDGLIANPAVLPLASKHGGLVFVGRDAFGKVYELHSMFTPEGWGREVSACAKQAFERIFDAGADLVFTHEQVGQWRTRPPKSFGFVTMGEPFEHELGCFRLWGLSALNWQKSVARERWIGRGVECQ